MNRRKIQIDLQKASLGIHYLTRDEHRPENETTLKK